MSTLSPEHAIVILNAVALPGLQSEHKLTSSVIAAIPDGKGDYTPDPVTRSAIDLAWHIATAEIRFLDAVAKGAFDLTPKPRPADVVNGTHVNAWYTLKFAHALEQVRGLSGEQLARPIDFRGMFTFPAVTYLQLSLMHTAHHRGQLSVYLRPMGGKVPSIYGESYDARTAREQASGR
jgi:uncharacterized damage-inducible protein DinB